MSPREDLCLASGWAGGAGSTQGLYENGPDALDRNHGDRRLARGVPASVKPLVTDVVKDVVKTALRGSSDVAGSAPPSVPSAMSC
jgi:hypothetical protein